MKTGEVLSIRRGVVLVENSEIRAEHEFNAKVYDKGKGKNKKRARIAMLVLGIEYKGELIDPEEKLKELGWTPPSEGLE